MKICEVIVGDIESITPYERTLFSKKDNICPICGKVVKNYDSFELIKIRHKIRVYRTYFHENCVINNGGDEIAKEIAKEQTRGFISESGK